MSQTEEERKVVETPEGNKVSFDLNQLPKKIAQEIEERSRKILQINSQIAELETEKKSLLKENKEVAVTLGIDRIDSPDWYFYNPGGGRSDLDQNMLLDLEIICHACGEPNHLTTTQLDSCKKSNTWDTWQVKKKGAKK